MPSLEIFNNMVSSIDTFIGGFVSWCTIIFTKILNNELVIFLLGIALVILVSNFTFGVIMFAIKNRKIENKINNYNS